MPVTSKYQYHLKDHLGNVHLTFTTKPKTESATGTPEPANLVSEQSEFLRYNNAKFVYSNIFDKTNGAADGYSQRLSGGTNEVYGLAKSLSVMPGDTISMKVYAKYVDPTTSNWTAAFNTLISQIATGSATVVTEGGSYSTSTSSFVNGSYLSHPTDNNAPKAYLNWLIFNRDFGFVNGGYVRMTNTAKENGQNIAHELLESEVVITEPGYVYIYLSNESAASGGQQVEVYFDEFGVDHIKSSIVQVQDYYPFGLTFNSSRRENAKENRYLYNQGSGAKKFNTERITDLGLNIDLTKYRAYDPASGRWWQVDPRTDELYGWTPYNYSFNNPILLNDPEGDVPPLIWAILAVAALVADAEFAEAPGLDQSPEAQQKAAQNRETLRNDNETVKSIINPLNFPKKVVGQSFKNGIKKELANNKPTQKPTQKPSQNQSPTQTKPLPKPPTGPGSVPPNQRDPKRTYTKEQKKEMLDKQEGNCPQCGEPKTVEQVDGHHIKRHADGGQTTTENGASVCKECHKELHKKD